MRLLKWLFSITLIIRLQFYNVLRYVNIALVKKGRGNGFDKWISRRKKSIDSRRKKNTGFLEVHNYNTIPQPVRQILERNL